MFISKSSISKFADSLHAAFNFHLSTIFWNQVIFLIWCYFFFSTSNTAWTMMLWRHWLPCHLWNWWLNQVVVYEISSQCQCKGVFSRIESTTADLFSSQRRFGHLKKSRRCSRVDPVLIEEKNFNSPKEEHIFK